jgi:hypothetical protein
VERSSCCSASLLLASRMHGARAVCEVISVGCTYAWSEERSCQVAGGCVLGGQQVEAAAGASGNWLSW